MADHDGLSSARGGAWIAGDATASRCDRPSNLGFPVTVTAGGADRSAGVGGQTIDGTTASC